MSWRSSLILAKVRSRSALRRCAKHCNVSCLTTRRRSCKVSENSISKKASPSARPEVRPKVRPGAGPKARRRHWCGYWRSASARCQKRCVRAFLPPIWLPSKPGSIVPSRRLISSPSSTGTEEIMQGFGKQYFEEGIAVGEARGKAEGKAEGEARGKTKGEAQALVRLLEKRIGPVSEALRARIFTADL